MIKIDQIKIVIVSLANPILYLNGANYWELIDVFFVSLSDALPGVEHIYIYNTTFTYMKSHNSITL